MTVTKIISIKIDRIRGDVWLRCDEMKERSGVS